MNNVRTEINMKKGVLYSSIIGLSVVFAALAFFKPEGQKQYYQPREEENIVQGYRGAAEWLYARRANQVSGTIDRSDVEQARAQAKALVAKQKKSSLGLVWEEVGPDNIGGRTRAFLIDNQDTTGRTYYAASVSGGLFKSTNAGASWAAVNDQLDNLAVVSIAQASNGDIYFGTGEGLYYSASGAGSGGILGEGIYKTTDQGATISLCSGSTAFNAVAKLEVDPTNSSRIYAATNSGLQVSNDGGTTFAPILSGLGSTLPTTDLTMTTEGQIWFKTGTKVYKSNNNDGTDIVEVTSTSGTDNLPPNSGRMRISIAPQDKNYVYAIAVESQQAGSRFKAAYRSTDNGDTWTVIGERNTFLDPHGSASQGQGNYNNAVTVDPKDKDRILVGGVTLWEWSLSGGWQQIATNFLTPFSLQSSLWVHSDVHNIIFRGKDLNTIYVCSDGGISRSTDNGLTWLPVVKNYGTIQYYNISVGGDGSVLGGTQDNSNILINPTAQFVPKRGTTLNSGDGAYAEISKLNPDVLFMESQYGNAVRSVDGGENLSQFFDLDRMAPNPAYQPGSGRVNFADFVAPFTLYENVFDFKSEDSIVFSADSVTSSQGLGGGRTFFEGQFNRPQNSTQFIIDGVRIKAGNQIAVSDANGDFQGDVTSGSFDPATGEFEVTFNDPVIFEVVARAAVRYNAGDTIVIESLTNDITMKRTIPAGGLEPMESIAFQDPIQSAFFMGLTGHNPTNAIKNDYGGIWMTRNAVSNVALTPEWWHIGELSNGEVPTSMAVSGDGDILYVGCSTGRVYRFSNISEARDSASADIDDVYQGNNVVRQNTSVIQSTTVAGLPFGRAITGITIHPNDKDKVIITMGNYGNQSYVYYSDNGAAAIPNFDNKTGNLPLFPTYSAVFNAKRPFGQVVVGAEDGIYTTDNIDATNVQWTRENTGMATVPVFSLEQRLNVRKDQKLFGNNDGDIYAGTHGRGVFRTTSTQTIGIPENQLTEESVDRKMLNLYPNPAVNIVNVPLNLKGRMDVTITVRDINGKLVRNIKLDKVSQDTENVELNVGNLPSGTYLVTLVKGTSEVISGKLVKQ